MVHSWELIAERQSRTYAAQWVVVLAEIVSRLGASCDEAELAATLAVAEGWIEYHAHSLLLREPGRQMLDDDLLRKPRKRG